MKYFPIVCLLFVYLSTNFVSAQPPRGPQNMKMALHNIDSIKTVFETIKTDSNKVKTLYDLSLAFNTVVLQSSATADINRMLSYNDSVIKYASLVVSLSDNVKDDREWKKKAYLMLGNANRSKNNAVEALKYFYAGLTICRELNDKQTMGGLLNNIGNIFKSNTTNYEEAIKCYLEAYKISKEMNRSSGTPLFNIGLLYYERKQYQEALKYYLEGFAVDSIGPNNAIRASRYNAMGICYDKLGDYKKAQYCFGEALKLGTEAFLTQIITSSNIYLGIDYYNEATHLGAEEAEVRYKQAFALLSKEIKSAGAYAEKRDAYFVLSRLYERNKDMNKALEFANLYTLSQDSLQSRASTSQIEQIRTDYEIEKARADEKISQERAEARQKAISDSILTMQKIASERTLAKQRLGQEKLLVDERVANEKKIAEQKLEQEKKIAGEKAIYEKSIADEKTKQEKLRAEKQQMNNIFLMALILVMITSVFLIFYIRQRNQKKRAIEKTESIHKMAELEMQSLRSQLNPHFMFNSLNSIQTLILKEDSDKSQSYLSRFARLLRMLLENAEKPFVQLQKEIDFLQLYLSLENLRVPDLQYSVSIDPSLNTEQMLIPNMILQPYVENAIWHGLSYKETDKQLQIRINRDNGTIKYEIEDNGVGRKKAQELKSLFRRQHQSKGMELLNKRFKLLNGEYNSTIETTIADVLKNNEVSGTLVTIRVPVQLSLPSQN